MSVDVCVVSSDVCVMSSDVCAMCSDVCVTSRYTRVYIYTAGVMYVARHTHKYTQRTTGPPRR